jgi:MoaA/NifB/PqqE/SkfB family radical SAM enzyme
MIVLWRITTRCNLSCAFCAYDRRLSYPRTTTDPTSIHRILHVLADFQATQQETVMVSWIGGEPLLVPELSSLTDHATRLGLRISATTNGTTLGSPEVRRHVLDHYDELTISLDADDESHDTIRTAPGLYAALRKNVTALSSARRNSDRAFKLRINTVLLRSTIDRFPELARDVASWGVDELTFNLLGGRDRPEFFDANRPLPEQFNNFTSQLHTLRTELSSSGLTIAGHKSYLERLAAAANNIPRAVNDCRPGERFLFINEIGMVSPCSFTTDELGTPLAEIRTAEDVIALHARFSCARLITRPMVCNDCPSTQVFEKFTYQST